MEIRQRFLLILLLLSAVMVFLTYSPADSTYFWIYWCTIFVLLFFGYLMDFLFSADMSFVFDPNTDNWRRKTDPHS